MRPRKRLTAVFTQLGFENDFNYLKNKNINILGSIPFLSKHCNPFVRGVAPMLEHFPLSQYDKQLELQSSQMGPDLPTRGQNSHHGRVYCQYLFLLRRRGLLPMRVPSGLVGATTSAKLPVL